MRRLLIIVPLITFTAITLTPDSVFAVSCPAGYYGGASITAPSSRANTYGYYGFDDDAYNATSPALSMSQWSATWNSIGVAKGIASCNGTSGTSNSTSGSSDSFTNSANGRYCWCKMTEWTPSGGTTQSLAGKWVFNHDYSSASDCAVYCVSYCTGNLDTYNFRSAVFRAVGACTACPSGGTSTAGATAITQCYKPANTNYTTTAGTYHFSSNCYYTN